MPRFPIKTVLLGAIAYAVYKRRSEAASSPTPPTAAPAPPPAAAPTPPPAPPVTHTDDAFVAEEEAAAAAEAAGIGGSVYHDPGSVEVDADSLDPAMQPVYEAGGGPQEGFEGTEAELIEHAAHGSGRGDPVRDAAEPEAESDVADAEYGEADEEDKSDR